MYSVELYNRVRRACHVEGMSQSAAARQFGIDRKTVAKMLKHAVPPGYRRQGTVRQNQLETGRAVPYLPNMTKPDPFRYFKTSCEIIRLAVMMYVRFPLSLRNVEDLLHERGIDVSHEAVRYWWHRFGPMFAAEIRKRRIEGMKSSRCRWHLDESVPRGSCI